MPGMGGHNCLKELLQIDPEVQVIISSGYSRDNQLKDTLDLGVAGFLTKPFTRSEMVQITKQSLMADTNGMA